MLDVHELIQCLSLFCGVVGFLQGSAAITHSTSGTKDPRLLAHLLAAEAHFLLCRPSLPIPALKLWQQAALPDYALFANPLEYPPGRGLSRATRTRTVARSRSRLSTPTLAS